MSLICIVHYHNQPKHSNINDLSEEDKKRILEAKALRKEAKRESHHELQCFSIPQIFSDSHGIHIHPCYKKYVRNYFSWLVFESLLFFMFKDLVVQISVVHKYRLFNSMSTSQVTIVRSSWQRLSNPL